MRGLAILLVMFYHMTITDPAGAGWLEHALVNTSALGATGVDLFFVLSGFLITGILFDTKQHHHYFRNFYIRRVLRIFPLYYAVLAFALVIMPALVAHVPQAHHKASRLLVSGSDWLWYASYTSNFLIAKAGAFRNGMLDVSWSLAIEEQFYVLWPPLVYCLSTKALKRACVGIVFFALVFRTAMWLAGYSWIQVYTVTPCRMDSLAIGGFFAVWVRTVSPQTTAVLRRARVWVGVLGGGVLAG
jgi:peptidoglycan/LPS O-acetylase OafA/YrhL